jgi:hypothetical protein
MICPTDSVVATMIGEADGGADEVPGAQRQRRAAH